MIIILGLASLHSDVMGDVQGSETYWGSLATLHIPSRIAEKLAFRAFWVLWRRVGKHLLFQKYMFAYFLGV